MIVVESSKRKRVYYVCHCINNMLCFILPFPFGYSAYASHFLICVTMKEKKSNAKKCLKVESILLSL
jgi:hypothetical protein